MIAFKARSSSRAVFLVIFVLLAHEYAVGYQLKTLASFPNSGELPGPLGTLAYDGRYLYGTTQGPYLGVGTVFRVGLDGSGLQSIYNLRSQDGYNPYGGVTLVGTRLFGVTFRGGPPTGHLEGAGTVFSLNRDGSDYKILKTFRNPGRPLETVVSDGAAIYGTTTDPYGSVFRMNLDGSGYQDLHGFNNTDGSWPATRLSLLGGKIYGATAGFGFPTVNNGTVFSMNVDGSNFNTLHTFAGSQGVHPEGDLAIVGSTVYGVTTEGGLANAGTIFRMNLDGSGFQTMYTFLADADGKYPQSGLIYVAGKLWGTTTFGGKFDNGTIFGINLDGSGYEIAHSFNGINGVYPTTRLLAVGARLYGSTERGGANGVGTIFSIQVPEPNGAALIAFIIIPLTVCKCREWRRHSVKD